MYIYNYNYLAPFIMNPSYTMNQYWCCTLPRSGEQNRWFRGCGCAEQSLKVRNYVITSGTFNPTYLVDYIKIYMIM